MTQDINTLLLDYVQYLGDNSMILGQRLGEWCGHGPILEQDIALTNIALDLIGEARNYYQYASELSGGKYNEDYFPFLRKEREFRNVLLVELPNGNWGTTLMRQFMFDVFHYHYLRQLSNSTDPRLASIAQKSLKEATYHIRFSGEWVIRLGDGTEESNQKMQAALDDLYRYFGEFFIPSVIEKEMSALGISPDLEIVSKEAHSYFNRIIEEATLTLPPSDTYMQTGGKDGIHTENMGKILSEMQYMQRAYPDSEW